MVYVIFVFKKTHLKLFSTKIVEQESWNLHKQFKNVPCDFYAVSLSLKKQVMNIII